MGALGGGKRTQLYEGYARARADHVTETATEVDVRWKQTPIPR